jgi:hypothetical protein
MPIFVVLAVHLAFFLTYFAGAISTSFRMDGAAAFFLFCMAYICYVGLLCAAGSSANKAEAEHIAKEIAKRAFRNREEGPK